MYKLGPVITFDTFLFFLFESRPMLGTTSGHNSCYPPASDPPSTAPRPGPSLLSVAQSTWHDAYNLLAGAQLELSK